MEFVETILYQNGKIDLIDFHINRLKWGLYQNGFSSINHILEQSRSVILNSVKDEKSCIKIRFLLDIQSDGLFSTSIELSSFPKQYFKIYQLGAFPSEYKSIGSPWNAKTTNRFFFQRAYNWAIENGCDDAIVFNEKGRVIETTIFNIYILKDNVIYTPPLKDMPVKGVYRSWLMANSIFPMIEKEIFLQDLYEAEMILLSNGLRGLQVGQIKHF
ncbi:MAG: aminotransferase class IV [Chitinophagales bacterium]|nr:aminotransferase class IV [Chitinophagales bacterium]